MKRAPRALDPAELFDARWEPTHADVSRALSRLRAAGWLEERVDSVDRVLRCTMAPREPGDDEATAVAEEDGADLPIGSDEIREEVKRRIEAQNAQKAGGADDFRKRLDRVRRDANAGASGDWRVSPRR